MSDIIPPGLADLPLDARRAREAEAIREVQEGLTRRHLAVAAYERGYLTDQVRRVLRIACGD